MELVMKSDGQPDKTFDLDRGELSLGRQSTNDIVVMDERASRKHAVVRLQPDGSVVLTDLNSSNGTLVNGRRVVGDMVLRPGDTIQIGSVTLTLQQGNAASFAPPAGQQSYDYVEPQRAYDQYAPQPQNPNPYQPQPQGNMPYQPQPQGNNPYQPQPNAYGQNYGGQQPNPPYGTAPMPQNQPNYQYGQNQPGARPATSNRRLFIIAGVAIIVILLLALGFFLINNNNKSNNGGGGGTPTPPRTSSLILSQNDTAAFQSEIASHPTLGHAETLAYRSTSAPDAVIAFYRQAMPDRGYNLNSSEDKVADHYSVLRYARGSSDWASIVAADRPVDTSLLDELTQIAPSLKGQIADGDTVFFIVESASA